MATIAYAAFVTLCITTLKEVNQAVVEPYMDEPFHVPQAQAYCAGDFQTWDPKLTTPPGLYILSLALQRIFYMKCTLPMLRVTPLLALLFLPIALTPVSCFYRRVRPPPFFAPEAQSVALSLFPVAWFFGFLYYTDVPSLALVLASVAAAGAHQHWLAAFLGFASCWFRQTNIIWLLYAYASSQLMYLRYRRVSAQTRGHALHDPPALEANASDLWQAALTFPHVLRDIVFDFVPYLGVLLAFGGFVYWNGGIVLGDKSNHIPVLHVPQLYYFVAFATAFGWPVLLSGEEGAVGLARAVCWRMCGSKARTSVSIAILSAMCATVKSFTIHHPFLLSDNRHYTFYIWKRVFMLHWSVPYLLTPIYMACAWAWFLRVGRTQSMLQALLLPIMSTLTLLPTPLLEPRYFLIPYVLLRVQAEDTQTWELVLEAGWYLFINAVTMGVFIYAPREGVGRFMW